MKKFILFFVALFLLACNEKNYTVNDFVNDEDLYFKFFQKCENGEIHQQSLNCQNVYKVKSLKQKEKWRKAREKSGAKL